jgi:hypothetical protein
MLVSAVLIPATMVGNERTRREDDLTSSLSETAKEEKAATCVAIFLSLARPLGSPTNPAVVKRHINAITFKKELMMERLVVRERLTLLILVIVDENFEFPQKVSIFEGSKRKEKLSRNWQKKKFCSEGL